MDAPLVDSLTRFALQIIPELTLAVTACVLFLAATWRIDRTTAAVTALIGTGSSVLALYFSTLTTLTLGEGGLALVLGAFLFGMAAREGKLIWIGTAIFGVAMAFLNFNLASTGQVLTVEGQREVIQEKEKRLKQLNEAAAGAEGQKEEEERKLKEEIDAQESRLQALTYSGSLYPSRLALVIRFITLIGGLILILGSWTEIPDRQAGEFHACLLLAVAGTCLTASANDLVTLYLSLELISIPTYVLLYLPRSDSAAQEAAMKYFLLSIFSSALLLFGFSYLYGLTGNTNVPTMVEALRQLPLTGMQQALPLVALVLVVAGLGFRISAVPFHFYAPDVYQGTAIPGAALLAFLPKVAGFIALTRLLGYVWVDADGRVSDQVTVVLWIMAAVTMTLGNVLAFLQDNVKRMLGYSSVAHAGYMLIGLAVAPLLINASAPAALSQLPAVIGGIEAMVFYLIAYGAMTIGAFSVLSYLSTQDRPVETVNDLSGVGRSHPGVSLLMVLFLFSLVGMPATAGFWGKAFLFLGALGVQTDPSNAAAIQNQKAQLFFILAIVGAVNAAISGYYYLRIAGVMFLGEELRPIEKPRAAPTLACILLCAFFTLLGGLYPRPFVSAIQSAMPARIDHPRAANLGGLDRALAAEQVPAVGP